MEEQRLENYLSMRELDLSMYEDKTTVTYISFPIYQFHTVDHMVFYFDIGAPYSCIRDKALERIFCHSGLRYIPIIDTKREIKFGYTLLRSKSIVELMLPRPGSTLDIPVIPVVVSVYIPPLLGLDVQDGNNRFVDNVFNHH